MLYSFTDVYVYRTFEERETLNENIVNSINSASENWGISCLRYEIRDITPPTSVKIAMDMQVCTYICVL